MAHCVRQENPNRPPDIHLDINLMSGKVLRAGFNIRPFTIECLEQVNQDFEVVVFTASHKWYADVILDHIDPEKKYFQHRLYRDHCIPTKDNVYIKDLRIFKNRDLKDLIIVDNAVYSFGAQLSNGIPIMPFKDDKEDTEFQNLMTYLKNIVHFEDMRIANRQAFKMEHIYKFSNDNYIAEYDYDLCDKSSDEEFSDHEEEESNNNNNEEENKEEGADEDGASINSNSKPSNFGSSSSQNQNKGRLPKSINTILDGFSLKMAKTKSFHSKLSSNKLL